MIATATDVYRALIPRCESVFHFDHAVHALMLQSVFATVLYHRPQEAIMERFVSAIACA